MEIKIIKVGPETNDTILDNIRAVEQNLGNDWDYDDGYGELKNLCFTAMDIADEIRESIVIAHQTGDKIVLGKDIPDYYKIVILRQLNELRLYLTRK